jgi:hypothetical protein
MKKVVVSALSVAWGLPAFAEPPIAQYGAAPSTVAAPPKTKPATLTDQQEATVREAIAGMLKDPESARFDGIEARQLGDLIVVCGWVNAKNAYGGYVGKTPFAATILGDHVMQGQTIIDEGHSTKAYDTCSGWGIAL